MSETLTHHTTEADETVAPLVFLYIGGVLVWLFAALSWVFYFRGYA